MFLPCYHPHISRSILTLFLLTTSLLLGSANAQELYVTDTLRLGLYEQPNPASERLAVLESGDRVTVEQLRGEHVQVRTKDDVLGWVKRNYLIEERPARLVLAELNVQRDAIIEADDVLQQLERSHRQALAEKQELAVEVERLQQLVELHANRATDAKSADVESTPELSSWPAELGLELYLVGGGVVLMALLLSYRAGRSSALHAVRRKFGGLAP